MHALLLSVLFSAAPETLAALDLEAQQVPPAVAKLVGTQLTQRLTLKGLRVVTASDLAAMLGVERQKELLGCSEGSSCLAEIGNALNARGVVLGSVGRLGETRMLNVKVVASSDGRSLAACSAKASSDEGLLTEAEKCADTIAAALTPSPLAAAPPPIATELSTSPPAAPRRTWALVPLIGGALTVVAGGVMTVTANLNADRIPRSASGPVTVSSELGAATALANGGIVVLVAGAALTATGAILFAIPPSPVKPVAMLTQNGGYVGVTGVFR